MTREETKVIIGAIMASYPNYKPADMKMTVDTWFLMLEEYSFKQIQVALKTYISTDKTGFAPSIGQIIDKMHIVQEMPVEINETAKWELVIRALRNSAYNAELEFENLDKISQKVLGSPTALREMALDTNFNESVEKSHFIKQYRLCVEREKQLARMPKEVRTVISKKMADIKQIEGSVE